MIVNMASSKLSYLKPTVKTLRTIKYLYFEKRELTLVAASFANYLTYIFIRKKLKRNISRLYPPQRELKVHFLKFGNDMHYDKM